MKPFQPKVVSRGYVASAVAGILTTVLFGLLAVLNYTAGRIPRPDPEPPPLVTATKPPDAFIEKPRVPDTPKNPVQEIKPPDPLAEFDAVPVLPPLPTPIQLGPRHPIGPASVGLWWPETIFDPGALDERPTPVQRVPPPYPYVLKRNKVAGEVVVTFIVDELGHVRDVQVESARHREFAESAVDAVRNWRFSPGRKDGRAVATRLRQSFSFSTDH